MMLAALFIAMLGLIILGMDIAMAMGLSALMYIVITSFGGRLIPLTLVPQQLMSGADSFALTAIPMFILAGELMNRGGITLRLVEFAKVFVGFWRGGLAHTSILVNMIMAGISGSALADEAATGAILIPAMVSAKYPPRLAAGVIASSSTIGPVIPPSIPMILIGSIAGVSIGRMFLGGAIPGIIMGLALMGFVAVVAVRMNLPRSPKPTFLEAWRAIRGGMIPLGLPVVILGSILTGVTTPTEAAILGVWYSFLVTAFVYRTMTTKELINTLVDTAVASGVIMFAVTAGVLYGWVVTAEQLGPKLTNFLFSLTNSAAIQLILINLMLLLLGMVMETIPIILIMAPILFPMLPSLNINPVHFGVVMVLNLMIGLLTPPIGLNLFVASSIAKISIGEVVKGVWPMIIILIGVLVLITYVPSLTLWLPGLVMR